MKMRPLILLMIVAWFPLASWGVDAERLQGRVTSQPALTSLEVDGQPYQVAFGTEVQVEGFTETYPITVLQPGQMIYFSVSETLGSGQQPIIDRVWVYND